MSLANQKAHLSPVWARYNDIIVDRGEGVMLYGDDGRAYYDFTCGIGVTNTGHCHPRVVAAIREQAGLLLHGQANIVYHRRPQTSPSRHGPHRRDCVRRWFPWPYRRHHGPDHQQR